MSTFLKSPAVTVFLKEVLENLRDRKTVINALVMAPLMGPVFFALMMGFMINKQLSEAEKPLEIPVIGAEHAPNLVAWLQRQSVQVLPAPIDAETALRERKVKAVLRIPASYPLRWQAGETAKVEILLDSSDQDSGTSVRRLDELLRGYQREQAALRLTARGLDPGLMAPVMVAQRDFASNRQRAGQLLSFLPYLLVIGAFVGGMYLAIDTTAGERERQSLEPLLINPASRTEIVLGKLGATFGFAMTSMMLSLVAFAITFPMIPLEKLGMKVDFGPSLILRSGLLMLPLVMCFGALQTLVAAYAKSYREAQTWLSMLMLLPMIPSVVLMMSPQRPGLWAMAVPLLSQNVLVMELARGEVVSLLRFALSFSSSLLLAAMLIMVTVRIYRREQLAVAT